MGLFSPDGDCRFRKRPLSFVGFRMKGVGMRETKQMEDDGETLGAFTVAAFCQRFGIGVTKVYEEIKTGRLRAVKVGTGTRILFADARAWATSLPPVREA